ncbi:hypothetical protein M407DRAFT_23185 [Tulasnella calospora MUT 4182]|uniref:Uncharacterized protein n=1 Tax=Tulasnella calospora MUT 4182 TaxID=1051891 RepID=A0A0C3QB29_9AGAM|nr:hypothetical protein M407DRAFT_23185 [Tulasnella calospora MUT 4182]
MSYPRWFRIILWPETAGDMTDPAIPEAPIEEFRNAFVQMRLMGYPKDRFPVWIMEKIREEDRQSASLLQAPAEAPVGGQSDWVAKFGPAFLTRPHRIYGTAAGHAARVARAFATRAQQPMRFSGSFRYGIVNPKHRSAPVISIPTPATEIVQQQPPLASENGDSFDQSDSQPEFLSSRATRWIADREVGPNAQSDDQAKSDSNRSESLDGSLIEEEEAQPIWWTFPSAPLNFNPAIQRVDLWGSVDVQCHLDSVDECLGQAASRYLHFHYYSQTSKAVVAQAYGYHHQDVEQFVKHLFRKGVLPMLATYMWDLLQTSFNWEMALKAGIGRDPVQGSRVPYGSIDAEKLDFNACPECRDRGRLILRVEKLKMDKSKGKGRALA